MKSPPVGSALRADRPRRLVPSGIDWIGDIPEGWKVGKVGYYYGIQLGKMLSSTSSDPAETYERYYCAANVHFDGVDESNLKQMWFGPAEKTAYQVDVGDLLVVEGGAGAGGSAIVKSQSAPTYIQNSIMRVRTDSNVINAHLCYWIESLVKSGYLDIVCNKATIPHFTKDKLSRVPFPIPPLPEQQAIAAHLDAVCGKIDALKEKIEKEIAALEEYRKSLITKCVTKGLKNCRLVPSGVDWIGNVPEGWKTLRVKYLASEGGTLFMDGDWINSDIIEDDGIRYLTSGNVGVGKFKRQGAGYISEDTFAALNCLKAVPGDLMISRLNEPLGRSCIIPDDEPYYVIAVDNVILRPDACHDKRYLMYCMSSDRYAKSALIIASGATMQRISRTDLGNLSVPVPPLAEQLEIAAYLDRKCAAIDAVVAKRRKQLEGLADYRKGMIYAYVTGKKEVAV